MIKVNSAECKNCGDVITSIHHHDYQVCKCWRHSENLFFQVESHPFLSKKEKALIRKVLHGIMVDGGRDYLRRGWYQESDFIDLSEVE